MHILRWISLHTAFVSVTSAAPHFHKPGDDERAWVSLPGGAHFHGFVNTSYAPNVEQYLGIPFAEPPLGQLRFLPPKAKALHRGVYDATKRPLSCSQSLTKLPSIVDLTPEFVPPSPYSEDCLYLNVFKPKAKGHGKPLPVDVWVHGGVLLWGGTNDPGTYPMKWVERSQEHIVVQINYRLNVFGFPNAAGLTDDEQNAGLQDARLALEWVRNNIAHFGGDPSRIILHGQSAGAALVDMLEYAYQSDPIAIATIHESAVASMLNGTASDPDHKHATFTHLATHFGCSDRSDEQLECMRKVDQQAISTYIQQYTDAKLTPALYFPPIADGKLVFTPAQYVEKFSTSKLPTILGFNSDEGATFVPYTSPANPGATPELIKNLTLWEVQCAVITAARQHAAGNAATHFYYYSGNFTNISPEPWMGAYHFAELPLVFGTHVDLAPASTPQEAAVSEAMQDLWLAFIKSPSHGLDERSWPILEPSLQMLHIAPKDETQTPTLVESAQWISEECGMAAGSG